MDDNLKQTVPAWPSTSMLERLGACRVMLYLHGYLTDGENDRVQGRLMKALEKRNTPQSAESRHED